MKCSNCAADLEPIDIGQNTKLVVDQCPSCGSMWLEKSKISRLDESIWADRQEEDMKVPPSGGTHGMLMCPTCATTLEPICLVDVAKLVVDRCPECAGLWLDTGEVSVLANAIKTSRPVLPRGSKAASGTKLGAGTDSRTSLGEVMGKLSDLL
jgi:Zn-finger nucleic acid-binding protein